MGRITKLQNHIGDLQTVLAEKNKLIDGFTKQVEQLTASCDAAMDALKKAKVSLAHAAEQIQSLKSA